MSLLVLQCQCRYIKGANVCRVTSAIVGVLGAIIGVSDIMIGL